MKTPENQQEIILITGNSFSKREFSNTISENSLEEKNSLRDELIKACWNGMLKELLPELFEKFPDRRDIFLWRINELKGFIELECGASPEPPEAYESLDPSNYLRSRNYN